MVNLSNVSDIVRRLMGLSMQNVAPAVDLEDRMQLVFRPKLHKIVELLVHLAHIAEGTGKYKAVKYFYLADLEQMEAGGRPITFEAYYALPSGPVGVNVLNLIEGHEVMLQATGLDELPFETYAGREDGVATTFVGKPKRGVYLDQLSESDVAVFERVVERYRHLSAAEIKAETHEHEAYKKAWDRRPPGRRKARMDYADMIPDGPFRDAVLEDIGPVARVL